MITIMSIFAIGTLLVSMENIGLHSTPTSNSWPARNSFRSSWCSVRARLARLSSLDGRHRFGSVASTVVCNAFHPVRPSWSLVNAPEIRGLRC